jgi:hypothetical protein
MKTRMFTLLALAAALVASRSATHYLIAQSAAAPYTIEMNLYDLTGPSERLDYPAVYAQTSEGVRSRLSYAGGSMALREVVRDISYPDGRQVILYDKLKVKTLHSPDHLVTLKERATLNSLPCESLQSHGTTKLRQDTFLGFPVTVVLMRNGDALRTTHWRAAAFGCMSLKYTVERREGKDGAWAVTYEGRATSAKLGEPDARLFDLGDDYETVTEKEAEKRLTAESK